MARRPAWITVALDLVDYHLRQQREHGESVVGRPSGSKEGWSIRNTAEAQKLSVGHCYNLMTVGKALKKNPNIGHASTFTAAVRLAKKEL